MNTRSGWLVMGVALILVVNIPVWAATTNTWSGSVSTDFETVGNWDAFPANDTTTAIAQFGPTVTGNQPSLTKNRSISGLIFASASGGWTLGGSYQLTIGTNGVDDTANTSGTTTINTSNIVQSGNATWSSGNGGNLQVIPPLSLGGNTYFTINSGTVTLSSLNPTIAGVYLTKRGAGTLEITGAAGSLLLKTLEMDAGTLILGNPSALGTSTLYSANATLQASENLSGATKIPNDLQLANIIVSGTNDIEIGGTLTGWNTAYLTNSLASGAMLTLNNVDINISNNRYMYLCGTGDTTINGSIGNGATNLNHLVIQNTGRTYLNGSSTFSSSLDLYSGTLILGNPLVLGSAILYCGYGSGILEASIDFSGANKIPNDVKLVNLIVSGTNNIEIGGAFYGAGSHSYLTNNLASGAVLTLSNVLINATAWKTMYLCGTGDTTINGNIDGGYTNVNILNIFSHGHTTLAGSNTFVSTLTLQNGVVLLKSANAIPGGIGSSGGLSPLTINGAVVELGAGTFSRGLGTGATQVQFTGSGGGFSAYGADRAVNLGGASAGVTWNVGSFIPAGSPLMFGSSTANAKIDFQNAINLGGAVVRTIQVDDNPVTTNDYAVLSGVVTNGGLVKTGTGTLVLAGATNNFTRFSPYLTVSNGTLVISGATTSTATTVAGGTLVVNGPLNGPLTVNSGGSIGGSGTVAPFGSVGTLFATINDANGGSSYLTVSGPLNVSGMALNVVDPGANLSSTHARYTVVAFSPGGLTGTFASNNLPPNWILKYNNAAGTIQIINGYPGTLIKLQ